MASVLSKLASLIMKAIKYAGPKVIQAAKGLGKMASSAKTTYLNVASKYASKAISKAGSFVSSKMKAGTGKRMLEGATKFLASEKVLKPIITDLTYKGAKAIAKKVPVAGEKVGKVMDAFDMVIGIPFI